MIKGSIQEEDITSTHIYARNIGAPQYVRKILTTIKGEIDSNTLLILLIITLILHFHEGTDYLDRKLMTL